jgi:hypothetical protein
MNNQKILNKNPEIAEILGAFIGDGWIESDKDALYITGSPTEDKDYYDKHLASLFSKHFTFVKPRNFSYWGVYGIVTYKKEIIKKAIGLGFQVGPKSLVAEIPKEILKTKNEDIIKSILRGIFDTDGSFWCDRSRAETSTEWKRTHNYSPKISITSCSRLLLEQMQTLLKKLKIESKVIQKSVKGFKCNRNINDSFVLHIGRKEDILSWFKLIGTNNPRHNTKLEVWKKLRYLPPRTKISDRIKMLKNHL